MSRVKLTIWLPCSFTGESLFWRMSNSFGYLTKEGYGGHTFPIIFGEVGSHLTAVRGLSPLAGLRCRGRLCHGIRSAWHVN